MTDNHETNIGINHTKKCVKPKSQVKERRIEMLIYEMGGE